MILEYYTLYATCLSDTSTAVISALCVVKANITLQLGCVQILKREYSIEFYHFVFLTEFFLLCEINSSRSYCTHTYKGDVIFEDITYLLTENPVQ
jgi:hypothetical protein